MSHPKPLNRRRLRTTFDQSRERKKRSQPINGAKKTLRSNHEPRPTNDRNQTSAPTPPQQDMAQPLDPLRLKGTMLDLQKAAARNKDKTGLDQRHPEELLLKAAPAAGAGAAGTAAAGSGAGDAMQVE